MKISEYYPPMQPRFQLDDVSLEELQRLRDAVWELLGQCDLWQALNDTAANYE